MSNELTSMVTEQKHGKERNTKIRFGFEKVALPQCAVPFGYMLNISVLLICNMKKKAKYMNIFLFIFISGSLLD